MDITPHSREALHFIVPCRGRLDYIKQSIEAALSQPNSTYTLVDYACPQSAGAWVEEHYPEARVVYVEGRQGWHASEARNLGAKTIKDGWLCFLDADIILHSEFSSTAAKMLRPGVYLNAPQKPGIYGLTICPKPAFDEFGGYDENLREYRGEDIELRMSLGRAGLVAEELPAWIMEHIDHDDNLRSVTQNAGDTMATDNISFLYVLVKDYLIRNGETHDQETLRELLRFAKDRFFAGFPWLAWMDSEKPLKASDPSLKYSDIFFKEFVRIYRTVAETARGYQSLTASPWGGVRVFKIARAGADPVQEMLTTFNRHLVTVQAPLGQASITASNLVGEKVCIPLENSRGLVDLSCAPIFLPGDVELVRDLEIDLGVAEGPSLVVEIKSAPHLTGSIAVEIALGAQPPQHHAVELAGQAIRLTAPVAPSSPERPEYVNVTVTGDGIRQEITRRTTFLTVPQVTESEGLCLTPPGRLYTYSVAGINSWVSIRPNSYKGPEDLSADVSWGWTDSSLVCWITRIDDVVLEGNPNSDGIVIAVDSKNLKAQFAPGYEFALCWKGDADWVELQKFTFGASVAIHGIYERRAIAGGHQMVVRLPFNVLGITPAAGKSIGVSMLFSDDDGDGRKGFLEWGSGVGRDKNGRAYYEITLV